MKKLLGDADRAVSDLIDGLVRADDRLRRLEGAPVLVRADLADVRGVTLISGGGSGHEPAHAGYIGAGMLTAAVLGEVFASPSVDAVLAAIRSVCGPAGCLLIVKNYTGDRLNFGLAAALARGEGLAVEMVLVDDDVALAAGSRIGRRGLAGTVLIHKMAGAAAASGAALAEVKAVAEAAIARLGTMGIGLTPCTVPGAERPNFTLGANEVEFGLGIHGEPGVSRETILPVEAVVERLIGTIVDVRALDPAADPLVLMVNGLGGTPAMELSVVARAALLLLDARGFTVARVLVGDFLTALEMAGCSLSLLPADAATLALLDADTAAPAWVRPTVPGQDRTIAMPEKPATTPDLAGPQLDSAQSRQFRDAISAVTACLIAAEELLTAMDREVGDGDLGTSLARGARAVEAGMDDLPFDRPALALERIAGFVRRAIGGSSGPLNAALLVGAASRLRSAAGALTLADWADALHAGNAAIAEIGGARLGDRTMLDALLPAADALARAAAQGATGAAALEHAAIAARQGAERTRGITAAVGRSSYLGDRVVGHADPGAWAVALWLEALAAAVDA